MKMPTLSLIAASLLVTGCFAPEEEVESVGSSSEGSTGGMSSSGGTPTTVGESSTDTPTSGTPTTDDETTDGETTDAPTSGMPTTDGETTSVPDTTGGEDPFCGDGNVDPGEECDDGLENNGLDQSCLPDCNLNVCGDGNVGPDEFCDDGEGGNVLEVGACAPDCSTVIEEKVIRLGDAVEDGDLGNNPVATADGTCPVGYRAMFVYGDVRRATTSAYEVVDPIDWVIEPWTVYVRPSGEVVWETDAVALLAVRNGTPQPLENAVYDLELGGTDQWVLTGLEPDWRSALSSTCDGWTTTAASVRPGDPLAASHPSFLRQAASVACGELSNCPGFPEPCESVSYFYCVED